MALKLPDSAVPMGDFPVAKAVDIDFDDGENLQEKLDNGALGGDNSTHKTTIFENNIDMGKYLLLAKITNANYSNNIIKFSCPNYKGSMNAGFKYEDDMDIYKFELHFNTGSMRENNSYGVTLKQHGLGLYSYPLNNPKNTEPRLEEAIRLYWDYSKGDIYVFLVDLMTAIPHCVLEYTGSGTLLREDTFVMDDLYNRRDGLNGTWEDSKWSSIPYNKLEVPPIYELGGGGVDLSEYTKTYNYLSELGLTKPVSVGEIFNAMPDNTMAMIGCEDIADHITDVPMSYGVLTIKKNGSGRFSIDYQNSLQGSPCNVKRWMGTLKGEDGTGLYWKQIQVENGGVITSDTIAKYGTEILKYPIGTWRIDSVNIGKQFTDLPYAEMAGVIEIDSIQPNKSPYEHGYGYRNYTFRDALNSTVYTRSLNSGNTVGTMSRDSGWCTTGSHFYKLTQMWLSANATIQEVIDAVPIGSTAILRTDEFTNWSTLFNDIQWGYFKVEKTVNGLSNIELQEVIEPNRRYFGTQSMGKFAGWKQPGGVKYNSINQLNSAKGTSIELVNGEDNTQKIMDALGVGDSYLSLYHNDSSKDRFGIPISVGNRINRLHIEKILDANGSSSYCVATAYMNTGVVLSRTNYGGTLSAWVKTPSEAQVNELFQSVSSGKTLVANAITGKGVSTATNATFATMATNISKISAYKEETKSLIVTSGTTGTEALPFTFSANVIAVKKIVAPSDSCRIVPQTSKNMFAINGKELIVHVTGSGTWKVTALIEK